MKEIRDKIQRLIHAYSGQLQIYQQISKVGSQEANYIANGQLDKLLDVLRSKEAMLKDASSHETEIYTLQQQLVTHFKLTDFSLPRLKEVASVYYQEDLASLEMAITELVPVLESLELQEQKNEASLTHYLEKSKKLKSNPGQIQQATRAYRQQKD